MAFLEWRDELSVGIGEMDRQHMRLVELLNRLHEAMEKGKGNAVKHEAFTAVVTYAKVHFAAEERLLQERGYPDLAAHQRKHSELTSKVAELNERIGAGRMVPSGGLDAFLKDWLVQHILQEDMKYSQFVCSMAY